MLRRPDGIPNSRLFIYSKSMPLSLLVDCAIIITFFLYIVDGYRRGFLLLLIELAGTVIALVVAFSLADWAGAGLATSFTLPSNIQKPVGFLTVWLAIQVLYAFASNTLYLLIPEMVRKSLINRTLGTFPSLLKGVVMVAITLTLIIALPIQHSLRPFILKSRLAKPLIAATQQFEQTLIRRYGKELSQSLTFLTNTPVVSKFRQTGESLRLHFTTTEVKPDSEEERAMLELINHERREAGLRPLAPDESLQLLARAHAKDMFARGYFSHDTPDGQDPFARMEAAGIDYLTAGENLALAPTLELAHNGLMNSPKHRDNILFNEFGRVGIGVIDGGIYGKMYVQEFTD